MIRSTMTSVVSRYCLTPGRESMAQSPASFSACRRRHVGHKQSPYCAARRAPVSAVNETTSHQHPPAQQTKHSPQAAHRFSRRIVVPRSSFIAALCSNDDRTVLAHIGSVSCLHDAGRTTQSGGRLDRVVRGLSARASHRIRPRFRVCAVRVVDERSDVPEVSPPPSPPVLRPRALTSTGCMSGARSAIET